MNINYPLRKKLLTILVCGLMFGTTANADIARAEMGIGTWMQTPSGTISYTDGAITGLDTSDENNEMQLYAWLLIKHPVPIIPNLRLEYVETLNKGTATGTFGSYTFPASSTTELSMSQIDIIAYYNILDNTGWVTLDLGLDIKIIDISYETGNTDLVSKLPTDISSIVIPLGYIRARAQIPATDFAVEADLKYITYSTTTVYDARIKVDYTLDISPVVQPAIEIGYRMQKFKLDEDELIINTDYSGVYLGMMLRF
ncbi:MAG: TIGR04219 family outer membrane beta-barrel protein [Sulfurimonas sp.]|nr:TIGR04219 family outer membrane beta-barrel protein [Sulfurimonas sp.]